MFQASIEFAQKDCNFPATLTCEIVIRSVKKKTQACLPENQADKAKMQKMKSDNPIQLLRTDWAKQQDFLVAQTEREQEQPRSFSFINKSDNTLSDTALIRCPFTFRLSCLLCNFIDWMCRKNRLLLPQSYMGKCCQNATFSDDCKTPIMLYLEWAWDQCFDRM